MGKNEGFSLLVTQTKTCLPKTLDSSGLSPVSFVGGISHSIPVIPLTFQNKVQSPTDLELSARERAS